AWYLKAAIEGYTGTPDAARAAADRCLAIAPNASRCLELLVELGALEGRCQDVEQAAKRWAAVDPASHAPYASLATSSLALGQPVGTTEDLVLQRWPRVPEPLRRWTEVTDRASLEILDGRFGRAEARLGEAYDALGSVNLAERAFPLRLKAELYAETG